ncbi:GGDEF domain-containing protein [Azoarcus sp. DN11]|uniref:sensor domain-containing diguanylate cyclase n=1 Tax=Azoarcus sp. DN11 TaxID=356837 RepID=UPI000EAEAA9B|nr:GGDEF domain-containing protein [Azoarcus sp. DN11]AYH42785.1 sensor domain-containing diguanylate cyclase [Azoarcus sp. DN11]
MSGQAHISPVALLLAGCAGAVLAGVAAATGMVFGTAGAWYAVAAVVAGIGALAAAALHLLARGQGSRRTGEEAIVAYLESLDAAVRLSGGGAGGAPEPDTAKRLESVAVGVSRLREIADGVHGVEALFDMRGRLTWISPSIERLTGWSPAACRDAPDALALLVHESDRRYCQRMAQRVAEGSAGEDFEMRLLREDGRICWVASHWRPLGRQGGQAAGLRMSAEDIQARKEAEYKLLETVTELRRAQALRERYLARSNDERQRLSALLNVIRLGILFMDRDHRVLYYNRAMLDIWGFPPDENLIGVRDVVLQSHVAELIEQPEAYIEHVDAVVRTHVVSEPYEVRFKDGRIVTDIAALVEAVQGRRGIGRVWIYEDVTEQRRTAQRLVELAEHDPLTGLYNRRRFHEELDRELAEALRRGGEVGLVAIDLDGFKPINDEFGHQAGDAVLVELSRTVGDAIRRNEMFCRVGGDEFCVLVPDAGESELCELARRIVELIEGMRFEFDGRSVGITASLGIAIYPRHASSAEALIAAADQAMYRSKSGGRDQWTMAASCGDESARMKPTETDEPDRRRED